MRRAAVSRDTLRFYERRGVLTRAVRRANGYRDYTESAVDEIRLLRLAQSVGFPLEQIKRAILYVTNPKPGCPILRAALAEQLAAVDVRVQELLITKARLERWLAANLAAARAPRTVSASRPRRRRAAAATRRR